MPNHDTEQQDAVGKLERQIKALVKALENYARCRHGEQECNCTTEARAALYPHVAKATAGPNPYK